MPHLKPGKLTFCSLPSHRVHVVIVFNEYFYIINSKLSYQSNKELLLKLDKFSSSIPRSPSMSKRPFTRAENARDVSNDDNAEIQMEAFEDTVNEEFADIHHGENTLSGSIEADNELHSLNQQIERASSFNLLGSLSKRNCTQHLVL